MVTLTWDIEDIITAHPDLYLEHCAAMAVAIMEGISSSPCEFGLECIGFRPPAFRKEDQFRVEVAWTEETAMRAGRVRRTEQTTPILERAAVALAALAFGHLMRNGQMRVTRQGERADYWLPRLRCALEVTGTSNPREFKRRCREKAAQVLANPRQWDGYVFACCLHRRRPRLHWSYHEQEE